MDIDNYLKRVKNGGLKITPKRRAVIEFFLRENRYLGPQEIRGLLKKKFSRLGLPSIYRILDELSGLGILIKVEKDRRLYYALCRAPDSDHHHFICTKCRKVQEVKFCNIQAVSDFIEKKLNGKIQSHLLQLEGLCSICR